MIYLIITIAIILLITGLVGCFLPGLPGAPLSYTTLIGVHLLSEEISFSKPVLIILGILTAITLIVDYLFPILGAKFYGISKWGTWGSVIGLLLGLIFFPPFGFIIGIFLGAIIGELAAGKKDSEAFKAGVVSFIGSILSIAYQFTLCSFMFFWFVKEVIVLI